MDCVNIQKQVKIADSYDAVICGGGPAGWVAAVSAARAGIKTALIERYGFLGGTATGGFVVPISGFFLNEKRVVGGIAWEFVERLQKEDAAQVEMPMGHVSVNLEYYKLIAQQMVEESGVHLYTNSYLTDCIKENGKITYVVIESKNGAEAIGGKCFIDATGDGDLCFKAGVPMLEKSGSLQPLSLCFVLNGADVTTELLNKCIRHNVRHNSNVRIRERFNELTESRNVPVFGGPWFNVLLKGNSLAVNMTRTDANAVDRESYTAAEARLRRDMFDLVALLKEEFPEFEDCEIVCSGINSGVRETRCIKGKYTLTADDILGGRSFECNVAHCAHPVDIHSSNDSGQKLIFLEKDAYVPYETMVSENFDNIIAAGRCVSAEEVPYASIRVQGTVMSIGEAAGVAAAVCCETGKPVHSLPKTLLTEAFDKRKFVL